MMFLGFRHTTVTQQAICLEVVPKAEDEGNHPGPRSLHPAHQPRRDSSLGTVNAPATPAAPCTGCGTTEGSRRKGVQYVRYRGERFGVVGMLCGQCRARAI